MAANHTENYGLCQWEGSDSFTRLDFNADNLAIDTALKSLDDKIGSAPWSIVASVSTQASVTEMVLDLSGIDLANYKALELIISTNASPVSTASHRVYLNSRKESIYTHSNDGGSTTSSTDYFMTTPISTYGAMSRRIIFMPPDADAYIGAFGMMMTPSKMYIEAAMCTEITWSQLTDIKIAAVSSTVPILSGSGAVLMGMV